MTRPPAVPLLLLLPLLLVHTPSVQAWSVHNRLPQLTRQTAKTNTLVRLRNTVDKQADTAATTSAVANRDQEQRLTQHNTETQTPATLTLDVISKLRFRELQDHLAKRDLPTHGTTGQLRDRLREAAGLDMECIVNEDGMGDDCQEEEQETALDKLSVNFVDESDPDFERKELHQEILHKAEMGHWKAATRKLKKYSRRVVGPTGEPVPLEILQVVLEACMDGRLQGARAAEPARKILEQYVEFGYSIPETAGNYCIKNCLGDTGPLSTHQGFGGIDTALAMKAALEQSDTALQLETMEKICVALAREGYVAALADAAVADPEAGLDDKVLEVLTLAKAAGFELDSIAKTQDGRAVLSAGLVAAERLDNLNLGLRLLTAARTATPGGEEVGYDRLVVNLNRASKRASVLIHKNAINKAVIDGQWKLAVKLLELKLERDQKTSSWVWRNVVTCCAKADKSRKATALLLDWVRLYEENKADQPPLNVFNTVVNACEICDEHELTLVVLDSMKKTHDTEGNIITFNIALKRLAKQGSSQACEGIIIGMLQAGIEPTVVSYTTAIAACVNAKEPKTAYEWLKRMRSRLVNPNMLTYNTAFAACLDGTLESTLLSSRIASEWVSDIDQQLEALAEKEDTTFDEYVSVIPDSASKQLARNMLEQLDQAISRGEIDERVAAETARKALSEIAEFDASERATKTQSIMERTKMMEEDQVEATSRNELELEFETASQAHRTAEV